MNTSYNVWLVRSEEYALDKYMEVKALLEAFPGCLKFKTHEKEQPLDDKPLRTNFFDKKSILKQEGEVMYSCHFHYEPSHTYIESKPEEVPVRKWTDMFDKCDRFRRENDIGDDEFVILLTEHSNEYNWFTGGDPLGKRNLFVHTGFWDYFSGSDQRFPVAYHIVSAAMKKFVFHNYEDLRNHLHTTSEGCINDFCENKKEVSLKLRTADICPSCMELFQDRKLDKGVLAHVLQVIEGIRAQMVFKNRWNLQPKPIKLQIKGRTKEFSFPDLGNLPLKLTPLEKTVYLFFLNHPEGVKLSDLCDHREEILNIYDKLYIGINRQEVSRRIDDLCNTFDGNSASEKISNIKRKIKKIINTEIAFQYQIRGNNGAIKKIALDRSLVEYVN